MSDPTIIVRDRLPGDFGVTVDPCPAGSDPRQFDGSFATHKSAYGYAVGLRMTHGWPVRDDSREARHG